MWFLFSLSFIFGTGVYYASCFANKKIAEAVLILDENDNPPTHGQGMFSILHNSQANCFVALVEGLMRGD